MNSNIMGHMKAKSKRQIYNGISPNKTSMDVISKYFRVFMMDIQVCKDTRDDADDWKYILFRHVPGRRNDIVLRRVETAPTLLTIQAAQYRTHT